MANNCTPENCLRCQEIARGLYKNRINFHLDRNRYEQGIVIVTNEEAHETATSEIINCPKECSPQPK